MFVTVGYYDERFQGFKTQGYTYFTNLPLTVGQVVKAPVKNRGTGEVEDKRAKVLAVDVDEPKFTCSEIVSIWTDEDEKGGQ